MCAEEGEQVLEEWKKLRSYVVGVSTGEATEKLGLIPIGEETGSAEKLAEFIVAGQFFYFVITQAVCDRKMIAWKVRLIWFAN